VFGNVTRTAILRFVMESHLSRLRQVEEALGSPEWERREWATRQLGLFSPEVALPMLRRALHDPRDTGVTLAAMETLLTLERPEAKAMLVDALINGDEDTADHLYTFLLVDGSDAANSVLRAYDELELD
jgi:hypothetical protein